MRYVLTIGCDSVVMIFHWLQVHCISEIFMYVFMCDCVSFTCVLLQQSFKKVVPLLSRQYNHDIFITCACPGYEEIIFPQFSIVSLLRKE